MSNVIGFKGTPEERLLDWNTMLFLRKLANWKGNPAIETEKEWFEEELKKYTAPTPANDNEPVTKAA